MLRMAKHAGQYAELSRLLFTYGREEIAQALGFSRTVREDEGNHDRSHGPEALARDIEKLGPAYIKLAQIISSRNDIVPESYRNALRRLHDDVTPVGNDKIYSIIEEELHAKPNQLFAHFDEKPMACASLGQVYGATLHDGSEVVVKVQRPEVANEAHEEIAGLRELAKIVDRSTETGKRFRFVTLVDAVDYALSIELDYRREAANLERLRENLIEFEDIRLPKPITNMVSRRVLVMERLPGTSLDNVSGTVLAELDTESLARSIIESYLKQILADGLFHADPHPGNLLLTTDRQLGLIDGGMVVSVSPELKRRIGSLLLAVSEREGEEAARIVELMGRQEKEFCSDAFRPVAARIIAQPGDGAAEGMSIGAAIVNLLNAAGEHGLILPFELILFSKAVLQIEATLDRLAPRLNVRDVVRDFASRVSTERAKEKMSLVKVVQTALDSAELVANLPSRMNRITELLAENQLRVKVDTIDEKQLLAGVHKIANRITAGLVTSALIVGASLLMRIDAGPSAFGYPLLPTIFFLIAAITGLYLVWRAIVRDPA